MENKYDKIQVGKRLKEFRQSLHITQKDFANSLNWSNDAYRKIETGKVMITSDKLQQLYALYHADICYILTGEPSYFTEVTEDSLLNLHLCTTNEQWLSMQMRMIKYYQAVRENPQSCSLFTDFK